jgi:glycosyltransferase involved in cell wall biosynthesis
MAIPRLLHQTWKTQQIPAEFRAWQQSCLDMHQGWQYKLWTDDDNRQFIATHFPWFLTTYDNYPTPIMRVDAVRYFILLFHGGVFLDLDYECLQPLDGLIEAQRFVVGVEPESHLKLAQPRIRQLKQILCPTVMASEVGHPFLHHVCRRLISASANPGVLDATGPFFLSAAYDDYPDKEHLYILEASQLYPVSKPECRENTNEATRASMASAPAAHGVHHWQGTWFQEAGVRKPAPRSRPDDDTLKISQLMVGRVVGKTEYRLTLAKQLYPADYAFPLVSCLMVTRGRAELASLAIRCYQAQTYPQRELIVVDDDPCDALERFIQTLQDPTIRLFKQADAGATLGELRQRSVDYSSGDYLCQWDDDDLYDPRRIECQLFALLGSKAEACFLQRWMLWWPHEARLAISKNRVWEGSLLCRRDVIPGYQKLSQGEDSPLTHQLLASQRCILLDKPELYLYVVHGANTFDSQHFEAHWEQASHQYSPRHYWSVLDGLATRIPVAEYLEILRPDDHSESEPESRMSEHLPSATDAETLPRIAILTPVKDASASLDGYADLISTLDYPREKLSISFLESDSRDDSYARLEQICEAMRASFQKVSLIKKDYGFRFDGNRWEPDLQLQRRANLAKARNILLTTVAPDIDWVVWMDADMTGMPADLLQRLVAYRPDTAILTPHCVRSSKGPTFDLNAYQLIDDRSGQFPERSMVDRLHQPPRGYGRIYMEDLRSHDLVPLDSVGCTVLAVQADLHRQGLVFPPFPYAGLIESEAMALMARQMGVQCWGLPNLEVIHAPQ